MVRIIRQTRQLDIEIGELTRSVAQLKAAQDARASLRRELESLLRAMDTHTAGNAGWEGRIGWLLAEVVKVAESDRAKGGA